MIVFVKSPVRKFDKFDKLDSRTSSAHDFSDSQSNAGFGSEFSNATPPVRKNRHN